MLIRPKTTVVLAMTADGKIASCDRSAARFSSTVDKAHLEKQISLADGVLFGAGTLRAYQTTLTISNPQFILDRKSQGKPSQPIQIVCSISALLDPQWRFFKQSIPRWLLTTSVGAKAWQEKKQEGFERILVAQKGRGGDGEGGSGGRGDAGMGRGGDGEGGSGGRGDAGMGRGGEGEMFDECRQTIDWIDAFVQLKQLGIDKLAILGGGEIVASLLEMDLIDEFWLTICPIILGGANSPTPVEGIGFTLQQARLLELLSIQQIEQEIFLHYRLQR